MNLIPSVEKLGACIGNPDFWLSWKNLDLAVLSPSSHIATISRRWVAAVLFSQGCVCHKSSHTLLSLMLWLSASYYLSSFPGLLDLLVLPAWPRGPLHCSPPRDDIHILAWNCAVLNCATELSSPAGSWDQSFQPVVPGPLGSVDVSQGPGRVEGAALGGTFN